jgi:5-(carboxyamino)imidazole ribonucleotide mutase
VYRLPRGLHKGVQYGAMVSSNTFAAILMGSDSDLPSMQPAMDVLASFGINYEVNIKSAHRRPEETAKYVREADTRGCAVYIAGAGLDAHLAGVIAAQTLRPVIGAPMDAGPLNGFDALLSTVQMPGRKPVACVAIGKTGAKNAGYLAAQILAVFDTELSTKLRAERDAILKKDAELRLKAATVRGEIVCEPTHSRTRHGTFI